ncbi:A/G-specific adenine glycosylase [Helicobacter baculiformis]|uniref:Adenine DNA glycosylase n=1 Tax=Helicobacter baculiformis TaxID=427351 RepID=A0ABV7ZL49_9HELI|nr:A/G-specific adenine glycosylase [Helicobacter baculiformis]
MSNFTSNFLELQEALLKWYARHGRRDMPIRHLSGPHAPYQIYISEIMSQQTQISVVLERYFNPFLQAFPTLSALASAPLDRVLCLWRGLGYYARARNLHKSAQICCDTYGGQLPRNYAQLRALPGVGAYSARAILCFGFGQAVGVVDANVARVLLRLFAISPTQPKLASILQEHADMFVNLLNPFDHNQALIDLGALVCTKEPRCHTCPLNFACQGKSMLEKFSARKKVPSIPLNLHCGVCLKDSKLYLSRATEGLYAHLYQFPLLKNQELVTLPLLGSVKHSYTKYRVQAMLYHANLTDLQQEGLEVIALDDLENTPMSALSMKLLNLYRRVHPHTTQYTQLYS